jgi:2-dehydro-3-deoxygluconokinase
VDWDYVRQAEIVHLTGITPALSPSCHQIVQRAFAEAKEAGVRVSFDVNYRAKLWSPEEARACLGRLAAEADILISTLSDAAILCARGGDAETLVRQLAACMKCETGIAVVTDGDRGAIALYQGELFQVEGYEVQVVDRVGAGDAFAAGFLCGLLEEGIKQGLEYGIALAALKHTYYGDIAWCTREDLQRVITGSTEEGWR